MADPRDLARRPGPRRPRRTCGRYRADGTPCGEPTDHADGWCRTSDCPGYTTARPDPARFGITRSRPEAPVNPDPCPVDEYDISTLGVTRHAVDRFLGVHGQEVGRAGAEASLRAMIADFAGRGRWSRNAQGRVSFAYSGFYATVTPDLALVADYGTCHAERTWAQVRAGVPSRGEADRRRRARERRLRSRLREAEEAGIAIAPGLDGLVVTGPDGWSMEVAGRTFTDLTGPWWHEFTRMVRERWGVEPVPSEQG
ncbi:MULTISPECIES: hypothetical protein [unclassified Nocardiopsis]|uniref:hypothetical protein n=1 Tax=Nocardiopsis TaxID=2013 RepID=UPI00387A9351